METVVENDVVNGTEMVPVVETGEIVPVNNNGEIQEVTAGQAALVLGGTMLVGYGIGKLGELVFDKWVGPACGKLANKWQERKARKEAKKKKDMVEVTVIEPEGSEEESKDKYEKASEKIRANGYKK